MSKYSLKHTVEGPFIDDDPIEALSKFYRTNGYSLLKHEEGERPRGLVTRSLGMTEESQESEETASDDEASPDIEETSDAATSTDDDAIRDDERSTDDENSHEEASTDDEQAPDEETSTDDAENLDENSEASEPEDEKPEPGGSERVRISAKLERGKPGASIWTSNMTELHALTSLRFVGATVQIEYEVETTMQHLTDEDRAFWAKEARKAESYVTGKVDAAIDWRDNEAIRVERQQRDILIFGIQMMLVAAIATAIIYFTFIA